MRPAKVGLIVSKIKRGELMQNTYLFREKAQPSLAYKPAQKNKHQTRMVLYEVFLNNNGHLKRKGTFMAVNVGVNVDDSYLEVEMINWLLQKEQGLKKENIKIEVSKNKNIARIGER